MKHPRVERPRPIIIRDTTLFMHTWFWVCPLCGDRATFAYRTRRLAERGGQAHLAASLAQQRCPGQPYPAWNIAP